MLGDYLASNVAWFLFNIVRFHFPGIQAGGSLKAYLLSSRVIEGQIIFPLLMMGVYYLSGYYNQPFFKSRIQELVQTLGSVLVNTLLIFFIALINDVLRLRIDNYELLLLLYGLQFVCVYAVRATITGNATTLIHRGKWQFNTFIIGCGSKAVKQMRELEEPRHSLGYRIVGFIRVNDETADPEIADRTYPMEELPRLCREMKIQELIVAPEEDNLAELHRLINTLYPLNLPIKLGTDEFNIISSRVRLTNIYGAPLIDMSNCAISEGGKNMKRMFDILVSAVALVLLSPLFVVLAILIKRDSSGPVFYQQERNVRVYEGTLPRARRLPDPHQLHRPGHDHDRYASQQRPRNSQGQYRSAVPALYRRTCRDRRRHELSEPCPVCRWTGPGRQRRLVHVR